MLVYYDKWIYYIVPLLEGDVNLQQGLFSSSEQINQNLPECLALKRHFLSSDSAKSIFDYLVSELNWQQPTVRVWGQDHKVPRLQYWMGEIGQEYQYSGKIFKAEPWLPVIKKLKDKVESVCQLSYNSVLLNWYRNGDDKMGWHADNEEELGPSPSIAMVSLGAERTFQFRHNETQITESIELNTGSLLLMKPSMQETYQHQVPQRKKVSQGRISLTFRNILK